MRKTYDIAGDLDTPVSAFMKLGAFQPRFLLESVEGGERLGRYSFIGFGDSVEYRLDSDALYLNGVRSEAPTDRDALLASLRGALARVARPQPEIAHVPLAGGLVGYAAYDVVRWFEKLPAHTSPVAGTPLMHYVAPRASASRCDVRSCMRCAAACRTAGLAAATVRPGPRWRAASTSKECSARKKRSPRATYTSSCCRRSFRAGTISTPFRSTARCV